MDILQKQLEDSFQTLSEEEAVLLSNLLDKLRGSVD
jgi:hypothetical protein